MNTSIIDDRRIDYGVDAPAVVKTWNAVGVGCVCLGVALGHHPIRWKHLIG